MEDTLKILAAICSGGLVLFALLSYVRGGFWNAKAELEKQTRTLTAHDERLRAVEAKVEALASVPARVGELKHAVDRLDIQVMGELKNLGAEIRHLAAEGTARANQITRVENFLLDQAKSN